jgi:hypothetical protein
MGTWGEGPFDSDSGLDWSDEVEWIFTGEKGMENVDPADIDQASVQFFMENIFSGNVKFPNCREVDEEVIYTAVGLVALGLHGGQAFPPLSPYAPKGTPLLSEATAAALVPQAREALNALRENKSYIARWRAPESYLAALDTVDRLLSGDSSGTETSETTPG